MLHNRPSANVRSNTHKHTYTQTRAQLLNIDGGSFRIFDKF